MKYQRIEQFKSFVIQNSHLNRGIIHCLLFVVNNLGHNFRKYFRFLYSCWIEYWFEPEAQNVVFCIYLLLMYNVRYPWVFSFLTALGFLMFKIQEHWKDGELWDIYMNRQKCTFLIALWVTCISCWYCFKYFSLETCIYNGLQFNWYCTYYNIFICRSRSWIHLLHWGKRKSPPPPSPLFPNMVQVKYII